MLWFLLQRLVTSLVLLLCDCQKCIARFGFSYTKHSATFQVGSFRRGRTFKGKKLPPTYKEVFSPCMKDYTIFLLSLLIFHYNHA